LVAVAKARGNVEDATRLGRMGDGVVGLAKKEAVWSMKA